ncbi:MAG TPA: hypothetical protein VEW07_01825 [Solirubrobacterales bacterium]|nr:hypothetical protein [Solirubrobacterales bacterium]
MPLLPALRPGGYFVFVLDAVVPDDETSSEQVDHQGSHREGRGRMQDIGQDNQRTKAESHSGETYCQRSNHGGSLAKHRIENENSPAK